MRRTCLGAGTALLAALIFTGSGTLAQQKDEGPFVWDGSGQGCNPQGDPDLCIPLDDTWEVVRFDGDGGNGEADPADPCQQNDDDISLEIPLGFVFDLYGSPQTSIFINNNGNVSFGAGYPTYTPEGFPVAGFPMVAPFWADVDTRAPLVDSGVVWMKQGPNYLAVTWDHVGYYFEHTDKVDTFQLIISDGTYEPMGIGNNVCFCFGDMQWTTGDASGGSGGFGGSPATVGVNKGDGIDYFLIGRFDHPGTDYDGPGGNADGVDWLDAKRFCFFVGQEFNQPPVPIDFPAGDLVTLCAGQTLQLTVGFIGPEDWQTVHTDVDDGGLANFTWTSTDGNPSLVTMEFSPAEDQAGDHLIHLVATDDGVPPQSTDKDFVFRVRSGVPRECGASEVNADCGDPVDVVSVNGIYGDECRFVTSVDSVTPLTFRVDEPPSRVGDAQPSRACLYGWYGAPTPSDIVVVPKGLGTMCFGPYFMATKPARRIFNALGHPDKLGEHNSPFPPPVIPDGGAAQFSLRPIGTTHPITATVQGIVEDDCSQGDIALSITNAIVLLVE